MFAAFSGVCTPVTSPSGLLVGQGGEGSLRVHRMVPGTKHFVLCSAVMVTFQHPCRLPVLPRKPE